MRLSVPRWILPLGWLAVGIGTPAALHAECAMSSPALAPPSGNIPKNPVLRLFLPVALAKQYAYLPLVRATMNGSGAGVAVAVNPETTADDLAAYRIEIAANAAGLLKIELLNDVGAVIHSWSLQVDAGWKAPGSSLTKVTTSHEVGGQTCSPTKTRNLHFAASASAYRIVVGPLKEPKEFKEPKESLPPGPEAKSDDKSKGFVLPRVLDPLWGKDDGKDGGAANLALGYANCFGDSFDGSRGVGVTVLALLPDGSEQPVTKKPLKVTPP